METTVEKELEALRLRHHLRLVTDEEEGTGIDRLPNGVYGYTYSPAEENFPLFKTQDLRSYEAYRLSDGSAVLVGFLTRDDADKMAAAGETVTVHLFPAPKGDANKLVTVPMARVVGRKEYSQRTGRGLELYVGPVS